MPKTELFQHLQKQWLNTFYNVLLTDCKVLDKDTTLWQDSLPIPVSYPHWGGGCQNIARLLRDCCHSGLSSVSLLLIWDYLIWDYLILDYLIWDYLIWDYLIWDYLIWDYLIWDYLIWYYLIEDYLILNYLIEDYSSGIISSGIISSGIMSFEIMSFVLLIWLQDMIPDMRHLKVERDGQGLLNNN
jgi:hypothetical protein